MYLATGYRTLTCKNSIYFRITDENAVIIFIENTKKTRLIRVLPTKNQIRKNFLLY